MWASQRDIAPPAYDHHHESTGRIGNNTLPIPPPATHGKSYFDNETTESIELDLRADCPYPDDNGSTTGSFSPPPTILSPFWCARLIFKCENVPQLMREGLYWSLSNVQWEDGFITSYAPAVNNSFDEIMNEYCLEEGLMYTRHYFLHDLQVPPRWIAHFQIHADTIRLLADLRLESLCKEHVYHAIAWSFGRQETIYRYDKSDWEGWYNVIYDDMPLEGWWPWPKKENIENA
ncbi:hypothetical protein F4781DRAFT_425944 [Annulohypoxylon bovei var. microspora]|nr:hypothetical protein F4781DRAFT_425944 [Annulohypoxylon bovei var. microspora]